MHCVYCGCFLTSNDHSQSRENKTSSLLYRLEVQLLGCVGWEEDPGLNNTANIHLFQNVIENMIFIFIFCMIFTVEELIPNTAQL